MQSDIIDINFGLSENFIEKEKEDIIIQELLNYIIQHKKRADGTALLDLILDFSFRTNINIESLGLAISKNTYVKNLLSESMPKYFNKRNNCQLKSVEDNSLLDIF